MTLRKVLPLSQIVVAVFLWWRSYVWGTAMMHVQDMPGTSPYDTLLHSLNAPLVLLRGFFYWHLSEPLYRAAFLLTIGLFWYWVALNIEAWSRDRSVFIFRRVSLRVLTDLLLFALGLLCGFWFVQECPHVIPLSWSWSAWGWEIGLLGPLLIWSFVLVFFFGRDFVHCVRGKKPPR
jgi:hypothetical protein